MSEGRLQSRAAAWGTALIGAVVVYVLSWPAVEIMCAKFITAPRSKVIKMTTPSSGVTASLVMTGSGTLYLPQQPYGIRMLYRPLHKLCQPYDKGKLLYRYWAWWCERFGQDAGIICYGDVSY